MLSSSIAEDPAVSDTRNRSERLSRWTQSEKIIALILVILLSTAAAAYVGYYATRSPPAQVSQVCSNGGVNYPSCNACPTGQSLANNRCSGLVHCSNGATDPGTCMTCPAGQSLVSGSCINNCANGATNPPACSNIPCPNGATNNPTCTIFKTTTSLSCNPSSVRVNDTRTTCTATVTDTTATTGTVVISCPGNSDTCVSDPSSNCTLNSISSTTSRCQITLRYSGPTITSISVHANYTGDSTHLSSGGQYSLTILPPPATVTVSGNVDTGLAVPDQIEFQNTKTGTYYNTTVNSNYYNITLANFETYKVTIHYADPFGTATCNAGTLILRYHSDTLTRDFRC